MGWFQEKQASKEEDKQSSSQQWTRWRTDMVWVKLFTIWRNQGSFHTRIFGNALKILYFDAPWSLPKREVCSFTKRGHMQSLCTTHCLYIALRKRYVGKLRMSSTRRFAWVREYHVSYKNRTRNMVCKIHKTKTQDHLGNDQVTRSVTGKLGTAPWTTE